METILAVHGERFSDAAPATRASWCGTLEFARRLIPVKAFAAIATPGSGLCQLHNECGQRIQHRKWCPIHGLVADDQIVKAYEYGSGDYIELREDELDQLAPEDDKTIHLNHFFDPVDFDPILFSGRSLHLVPAHAMATSEYALCLAALQASKVWALTVTVLSGHRQPVIVRPASVLMLHVIHWPAVCRSRRCQPGNEIVRGPEFRDLVEEVTRLTCPPAWNELSNSEEVMLSELVQSKIAARQAPTTKPRRRRPAKVQHVPTRKSRAA